MLKDELDTNQFPLKLKLTLTCEFNTPVAFDIIEAHYSHPVQVIQTQNNLSKFYEELMHGLIDFKKEIVDMYFVR